MWKREIWMVERMPQTMSEVETRYCCISSVRFAALARMMGGVMMPANMARACWNPRSAARRTGIRSWSPKKGAALRSRFMKGRFGLKRNA